MRGYDLYRMFNVVVMLRNNLRQGEGSEYAQIMERLRLGQLTFRDKQTLNAQLVDLAPASDENLDIRPILVGSNKLRATLNRESVRAYARKHSEPVYRFRARLLQGRNNTTPDIRTLERVYALHDSSIGTGSFAMQLELAIGAPIMITKNVREEQRILNGTLGRVVKIQFAPNTIFQETIEDGVAIRSADRLPDLVFLSLRGSEHIQLQPNLPPGIVAVSPLTATSVSVKISKKKSLSFTVTQLPFVLAFSLTVVKS